MLDMGNTRGRTEGVVPDASLIPVEDNEDVLEALLVEKGVSLDAYLAQKSRTEIQWRSMTERQRVQAEKGMRKEWHKLERTGSIKVHWGAEAEQLRATVPAENILESRFVRTERDSVSR